MTRTRLLFILLVTALLAALVAPVGAAGSNDLRAQRDAARERRAELAAKLDELEASEEELLEAAKALNDQVLAQAARVDAARQAVDAAEAALAEATRSLEETRSQIAQYTDAIVERAVQAYMAPRGDDPADLGDTTDLAEVVRREAMADAVAESTDELLDQLAAAREDFELQQRAANAARERAQTRRAENESRLAELEAAEKEQRRIAAAVGTRQREVLQEIDEQARADSELTRLIRAREEAARQRGGGASNSRSGGCIWPADGRVTSEFGSRWGRLHAGIDISAPTGTPIWAAKAGVVIFAGRQSGYGNVVIISHGDMTTLYGHQSRIRVSEGQSVSQGDVIGDVGSTGRSTGPHLHFETRYGGSARNPRSCLG